MFGADQCGFTVLLDRTLHPHLVCLQPGVKVCTELCTVGWEGGREAGGREGREWHYSRLPVWGRGEGRGEYLS